jgi:hypothetical protein
MERALARHARPGELPAEPDREVGDVDHLLNLAPGLLPDLANLVRDHGRQILLVLPEQQREAPHHLRPTRRRHPPPGQKGLPALLGHRLDLPRPGAAHPAEDLTVDGRARNELVPGAFPRL